MEAADVNPTVTRELTDSDRPIKNRHVVQLNHMAVIQILSKPFSGRTLIRPSCFRGSEPACGSRCCA